MTGKNRELKVAEELEIKTRVKLGGQLVSRLPSEFREENRGRFIAITFDGEVLAINNTLAGLNRELEKNRVRQNYYIERIGNKTIAKIA